jgi:hypothetical protein
MAYEADLQISGITYIVKAGFTQTFQKINVVHPAKIKRRPSFAKPTAGSLRTLCEAYIEVI